MALRIHNLLLGVLKNDLGEVDEAMLQGVKRPHEIILGILDLKNRLLRSRLSYILSRRLGLRNYNVASGLLKKRLW
jgi:hypothetical protein